MQHEQKIPVLYSFRRCPFAIRARIAIYLAQIKVELREVLLRDKPQELLAISPKGTVPVLQLPTGQQVIDESLDIMYWALRQHDPLNLLEGSLNERHVGESILKEVPDLNNMIRQYKFIDKYPEVDLELAEQSLIKFLTEYNKLLNQHQYLSGDFMRLYDYALFPFIRQIISHDHKLLIKKYPMPALLTWHDKIIQSDIFKAVMLKYTVWVKGDEPVFFG